MTTKPDNLEQEFDALLRSHIKDQQSASQCDQFDPDSASAYLERALSQSAMNAYEAHLSACTSCRMHIIELSRLMPAPALAIAEGAAQAENSLKDRLGAWLSGWRLGLISGIGATAAAGLLIVFLTSQSNRDSVSMVALNNEAVSTQATPAAPLTEAQFSEGQKIAEKLKDEGITATNTAPAPSSTPDPSKATGAANQNLQLPEATTVPPLATGPGAQADRSNELRIQSGDVPRMPNQLADRSAQETGRQLPAERFQSAERKEEQGRPAAAMAAPPPPAPKPVTAEKATAVEEAEAAAGRSDAPAASAAKRSSAKDQGLADSKARVATQKLESGRNVNGKSFTFFGGAWVDSAYRESQRLPVVRLKRGSSEQQQTLKEIPELKPYFELGSVIVVWQGKVYEVR